MCLHKSQGQDAQPCLLVFQARLNVHLQNKYQAGYFLAAVWHLQQVARLRYKQPLI